MYFSTCWAPVCRKQQFEDWSVTGSSQQCKYGVNVKATVVRAEVSRGAGPVGNPLSSQPSSHRISMSGFISNPLIGILFTIMIC